MREPDLCSVVADTNGRARRANTISCFPLKKLFDDTVLKAVEADNRKDAPRGQQTQGLWQRLA